MIKTNQFNYRTKNFKERCNESKYIMEKYIDKVPIIVEKAPGSDIVSIDKNKYLVSSDMTLGQFLLVIRRRINLPEQKAMFVFIKNSIPPTMASIREIYNDYHDDDGFLYMSYAGENTFGEPRFPIAPPLAYG